MNENFLQAKPQTGAPLDLEVRGSGPRHLQNTTVSHPRILTEEKNFLKMRYKLISAENSKISSAVAKRSLKVPKLVEPMDFAIKKWKTKRTYNHNLQCEQSDPGSPPPTPL